MIKGTRRKQSIKYASSNISKIADDFNSNPNNENLKHKLLSENRKLDNLRDGKIKGILMRSKAEWIEGIEKNTAFWQILKKDAIRKNCPTFKK